MGSVIYIRAVTALKPGKPKSCTRAAFFFTLGLSLHVRAPSFVLDWFLVVFVGKNLARFRDFLYGLVEGAVVNFAGVWLSFRTSCVRHDRVSCRICRFKWGFL